MCGTTDNRPHGHSEFLSKRKIKTVLLDATKLWVVMVSYMYLCRKYTNWMYNCPHSLRPGTMRQSS